MACLLLLEASAISLKALDPTDDLVDLDNDGAEQSISDLTSKFKQEQQESKEENEKAKQSIKEPAAPKNQTSAA